MRDTGLADLAAVFGHHAHVSASLSELEGRWAGDETDAAVRVHLARFGRYHGWHAELWTDLLPDSVRLAERALVGPPDALWGAQLVELLELQGTAPRLAVLYRSVLPRLSSATGCLLDRLAPVSGAAALRSGGFVAADLASEQAAGNRLLHDLGTVANLADVLSGAVTIDVVLAGSEFGRCGA